MAEVAYQVMYLQEWIAAFERDKTTLRETVTRPSRINGRQAVFLVAASGSNAVTRGNNGLIPSSSLDLTQNTVTLAEAHSLKQITGFNVTVGQSDQRAIMQDMTRVEINRHIDDIIIDVLETGTITPSATATLMNVGLIAQATTMLWDGNVPNDGNVFGLVTPAAWAALSEIPEFASKDFVDGAVLPSGMPTMGQRMKEYYGVKWMQHNGLPGVTTNAAKCFIYHKKALGYGYAGNEIMADADYHREQDYSWARATVYDGALKLQNAGIIVINHDDTPYSGV